MTFMRGATRYYSLHGVRPTRPASAPREGPGGRPLLRAARRRRPRCRRRIEPRALQPRVPPRVRRRPAPVPAHAPARARRGAAPEHRSLGRRHLLQRRPAERRLVHDQLHAHVREVADGVPRGVPAGLPSGASPGLRGALLRAPATTARLKKTTRRRGRTVGAWFASLTHSSGSTTRTRPSPSTPTSSVGRSAPTSRCPRWAT